MNKIIAILIFIVLGAIGLIAQKAPAHDYVDLGLPNGTKWATCNIGSKTPHEYGNYYQWGELKPFTGSDFAYQGSADFLGWR